MKDMICRHFVGLVAVTILQACTTTSAPANTSAVNEGDTTDNSCGECSDVFLAQIRITDLFIQNLRQRLAALEAEAKCCVPYSSDPNAPMIEQSLLVKIGEARESLKRHQANLELFQSKCPEPLVECPELRIPNGTLVANPA
jgi:hypothetical protein